MDQIEDKGFIPAEFVESETKWFYNELGEQTVTGRKSPFF